MNFTAHFHTNYTSSGVGPTYTKVSIEVDGFGMFCVIRNKNTGRVQKQTYMSGDYGTRNYIGLSKNGYFNGVDSLKQAWPGMADDDRRSILDCVNSYLASCLIRFGKKCKEKPMETPFDVSEAYANLRKLLQELFEMNDSSSSVPTGHDDAESNAMDCTDRGFASMNWVEAKISSLSSNDLKSIMQMIYDKENPEEGVEYNGNAYRVMNDDSGRMVLRVLQKDATCEGDSGFTANDDERQSKPVATTIPPKPKRTTKRMAFMMNNENLTEFVNGCYYRLVRELNDSYITILNDANEERTVSRSRVSLLDVYDQPPFEEVTA